MNNRTQYLIEYEKKNLKRIPFNVKKEWYDEVLKPYCEKLGMPVNTVIKQALKEKMIRDGFIKEN